jgi:hypothetical protein
LPPGHDIIRIQDGQQVTIQADAGNDMLVFDGVASLVYGGNGSDAQTIGGQGVGAFGGNGAGRLVASNGAMTILAGGLGQEELITLSTKATCVVFESVRDSSPAAASADIIRDARATRRSSPASWTAAASADIICDATPVRDVLVPGGIAAEPGSVFDPATTTGGFVVSGAGPLQGIARELSAVMLTTPTAGCRSTWTATARRTAASSLRMSTPRRCPRREWGVFGMGFADAFVAACPIG